MLTKAAFAKAAFLPGKPYRTQTYSFMTASIVE
jgi:hypothetical protein